MRNLEAGQFWGRMNYLLCVKFQALNLRLKWPNDIFTGELVKIGGVLATCSINGSTVCCNIGK